MPDPSRRSWLISHILTLVLLPIAIYLPEWLGFVSSDPLMTTSSMMQNAATGSRGLIPGNPGWIDGNAGVTVEALGRLVARDWAQGVIPWWNPYSGVGMPLAGEYQPAAFFLPFVLFLGLSNGLLMMKCALQIVAGLAMYAFLKQLRLDLRAALIGGLLYAFNGTYAWSSDGPSEPLAFLPLALYGVERARAGNWGWLALGLGYSLLAGFPEIAFLLGLVALGLACLRFFEMGQGRARFALRITLGGLAACLIAGPQLLAFLSFLPYADVGPHVGINDTALPKPGWAMLLFPAINGPIFYGAQYDIWFSLGGYCGLALPFLALCAAGGRGRERGLRFLLLGFVLFCVGKQAGIPVLTQLVDLVPGVGRTLFFRYCEPVVESCLIVLAALALDDFMRSLWRRRAVAWAALVMSALALRALMLDRDVMHQLASFSDGPVSSQTYRLGALGFGLACLALMAVLTWRRSSPRLIGAVLLCETLVQFGFPLLSAYPEQPIPDRALIAALRDETGLQRFVTIGPVTPNYGAYLAVASMNHNAVPTPAAWIRRLRRDFGPKVDSVTFNGTYPADGDGNAFLASFLERQPFLFENLGVSALLVTHGQGLPGVAAYPAAGRTPGGQPLSPDHPSLRVDIGAWDKPATNMMAIRLGTYRGGSTGRLVVSFCAATQCARGEAALTDAVDNGWTSITLDRAIPADAGTLALDLKDATSGVMLWSSVKNGVIWPEIVFQTDAAQQAMKTVAQSAAGDVVRLKNPGLYFEAGPGCTLRVQDRETVTAQCNAPSRLIRREIMLPGWTARVNGARVVPQVWDDLFEQIALPSGISRVHFHFAPPGAIFGWMACAIGIALLGVGFWPAADLLFLKKKKQKDFIR